MAQATRRVVLGAAMVLPFAGAGGGALAQGAPAPDAVAARLAELGVKVRNQPVTAADLANLQSVSISTPRSREVTDADCALFQHLPRLTSLDLGGANQLTAQGLGHIGRLPRLMFLDINSSTVGDPGLEALALVLVAAALAWGLYGATLPWALRTLVARRELVLRAVTRE